LLLDLPLLFDLEDDDDDLDDEELLDLDLDLDFDFGSNFKKGDIGLISSFGGERDDMGLISSLGGESDKVAGLGFLNVAIIGSISALYLS
jgi:hypothetical protein